MPDLAFPRTLRIERLLNKKLLALDTSTQRAALALIVDAADGSTSVHCARPDPVIRHGRILIPAIRDLLAEAGLSVADLDGVAVGLGPGSYTGLRIGITAAKTLAYAIGKPLAGLDSHEIVARNAPHDQTFVAAIGDAQRGDFHAAEFARESAGAALRRISETRVISLVEWLERLPDHAFIIGPALEVPRLSASIPAHLRRPENPESNWPDPLAMSAIATEIWRSGERRDVFFVEPVYLRRSAAEDLWEQKGKAPSP